MQLNIKKKTQSNKWVGDINRLFSKEDIQIAKKHMKRHLTSLTITEMQFKTIVKYHHLTWARMALSKKSTNNKC